MRKCEKAKIIYNNQLTSIICSFFLYISILKSFLLNEKLKPVISKLHYYYLFISKYFWSASSALKRCEILFFSSFGISAYVQL